MQIFKSMCYSKYYAEITELYVDEGFRRMGIAAKIFEYVEEYFRNKNITVAQSFYEKQGYIKSNEIMYRKRTYMKYSD